MDYTVGKCGLLIGLVDNQSKLPSKALFEDEFNDENAVFHKYKESIESNLSQTKSELDSRLYTPRGYHLFGDCNMAILALIDDFAFPNRVLHSGHGYYAGSKENYKYTLQTINGIHTETEKDDEGRTVSLERRADDTFLKPTGRFPFIGITSYKINNGLLIGNGPELLELIKQRLYALRKTCFKNELSSFQMICIDTFSNNELMVVYFSDKLAKISHFTNETRIQKLKDLAEGQSEEVEEQIERIARNSLLYKCLPEETDENLRQKVTDSHVFSTSFSHLGYDMEIYTAECTCLSAEFLTIQYHWDLKPGHYIDFTKAIFEKKQIFFKPETKNERIMPGVDTLQWVVMEKEFNEHLECFEKLATYKEIQPYVRKQRINVIFHEHGMQEELTNTPDHPELVKNLNKCSFSKAELYNLRSDLDACRVSKVLKERTLKMYETFNDCIIDPLFFDYFIELKEYLRGVINDIHSYKENTEKKDSLEDLHTLLNSMIHSFEQAYYNRFHQSSRTRNISDFNLEYNGGIQQLISAYDMAYKVIMKKLVEKEASRNFVYVSGYERVSSDRNSLRINIFHITYPELYAATVWKEAMNFYWTEIPDKGQVNQERRDINQITQLLSMPETTQILRNQIEYSNEFDSMSYVHQLMLSSVNDNFIHYLLADISVFNNGYVGDFDLFSHWYWSYFSQMSHFYDYEGEMNPDVFIKFLVRWLFVKHLCCDFEEEECYTAFDPKLAELWRCYIHEAYTFTHTALNVLDKFDFALYADGLSAKWIKRDIGIPEERNTKNMNEAEQAALQMYVSNLGMNIAKQMKSFDEGKIIDMKGDSENGFTFIRDLMVAYLHVVKNMSLSDGHSLHILERDMNGKPIKRQQYNPVVVDPLGGIFLCDNKKRGTYYQLRSVFYKSLWGASLKMKKDFVDMNNTVDKKEEEG